MRQIRRERGEITMDKKKIEGVTLTLEECMPVIKTSKGGYRISFASNESKYIFLIALSMTHPQAQLVHCASKGCFHNLEKMECCGISGTGNNINIGTGGVCLSFKSKEGGDHGK